MADRCGASFVMVALLLLRTAAAAASSSPPLPGHVEVKSAEDVPEIDDCTALDALQPQFEVVPDDDVVDIEGYFVWWINKQVKPDSQPDRVPIKAMCDAIRAELGAFDLDMFFNMYDPQEDDKRPSQTRLVFWMIRLLEHIRLMTEPSNQLRGQLVQFVAQHLFHVPFSMVAPRFQDVFDQKYVDLPFPVHESLALSPFRQIHYLAKALAGPALDTFLLEYWSWLSAPDFDSGFDFLDWIASTTDLVDRLHDMIWSLNTDSIRYYLSPEHLDLAPTSTPSRLMVRWKAAVKLLWTKGTSHLFFAIFSGWSLVDIDPYYTSALARLSELVRRPSVNAATPSPAGPESTAIVKFLCALLDRMPADARAGRVLTLKDMVQDQSPRRFYLEHVIIYANNVDRIANTLQTSWVYPISWCPPQVDGYLRVSGQIMGEGPLLSPDRQFRRDLRFFYDLYSVSLRSARGNDGDRILSGQAFTVLLKTLPGLLTRGFFESLVPSTQQRILMLLIAHPLVANSNNTDDVEAVVKLFPDEALTYSDSNGTTALMHFERFAQSMSFRFDKWDGKGIRKALIPAGAREQ